MKIRLLKNVITDHILVQPIDINLQGCPLLQQDLSFDPNFHLFQPQHDADCGRTSPQIPGRSLPTDVVITELFPLFAIDYKHFAILPITNTDLIISQLVFTIQYSNAQTTPPGF